MWRFFFGLPLDLAPHLLKALACGWRAFRWLVLSPGLWRDADVPSGLIGARAAVLAAVAASAAVWLEINHGSGRVLDSVFAGLLAACVGAFIAVMSTLVQVMAQDAIHGD